MIRNVEEEPRAAPAGCRNLVAGGAHLRRADSGARRAEPQPPTYALFNTERPAANPSPPHTLFHTAHPARNPSPTRHNQLMAKAALTTRLRPPIATGPAWSHREAAAYPQGHRPWREPAAATPRCR
eukprot:363450-Chlamydomonas_euryale.AAC.2